MAKWKTPSFNTPLDMVQEFAEAMNQPLNQEYSMSSDLESMRFKLICEEFAEFCDEENSKENTLKELADMVYVCYGYAATFGWDLDEAIKRIHESNMSKLGDDGKPIYREDGKVLKGPNYKKPDLSDLV